MRANAAVAVVCVATEVDYTVAVVCVAANAVVVEWFVWQNLAVV